MTHSRFRRYVGAGLIPGLAIVLTVSASQSILAQPMSSGSGVGTGTGMMGGAARNSTGTGQEGGTANATGTGLEAGGGRALPGSGNYFNPSVGRNLISPSRLPRDFGVSAGPGVSSTLPGEPSIPIDALSGVGQPANATEASTVSEIHVRYAKSIPNPGDRSLALSRIASAATFSNQLELANSTLEASSAAALEMRDGMVRDQRLISIISALLYLAEAHLREGRTDLTIPDIGGAPSALPKVDRVQLIRRAFGAARRAGDLAEKITTPTFRSELMYRVADGLSYDSQSILSEFPRTDRDANRDPGGIDKSYEGLPDAMMKDAAKIALRIERPVWSDRALVAVAGASAESGQFARAVDVARQIPQPEVRTDAMLKIGEIQARRGDPKGATSTYQEAATAVASIPLDDPRAVLTGVLIDSLISVGRFDDARKSVGLWQQRLTRKLVARGAIAESQGRRGAARSALAWINAEIPSEFRSQLYRRVSNGVVAAIESNRSRDLSNRGVDR